VLLKNDANLLPLDVGQTKTIAVIGAFAKTPRYQGGRQFAGQPDPGFHGV